MCKGGDFGFIELVGEIFAFAFFGKDHRAAQLKPGQNGDWSPLRQATGIRSVYDAGFDYNIDEKDGHWSTSGNVRTSYTEDDSEQHTSSENFLTGGDTYGRAYSKRHTDNFKVRTNHEFNLYRRNNVLSYLGLRPDISYSRQHSHGESASAVFDEDVAEQWGKAWIDSIMTPNAGSLLLRHALNRSISRAKGNGHSLNTGLDANAIFSIPHNNRFLFNASGNISYNDEKRYAYDHYQLDYPRSGTPTDRRNRYDLNTNRSLNYGGSIGARRTEIGCLQTTFIHMSIKRPTTRYINCICWRTSTVNWVRSHLPTTFTRRSTQATATRPITQTTSTGSVSATTTTAPADTPGI